MACRCLLEGISFPRDTGREKPSDRYKRNLEADILSSNA